MAKLKKPKPVLYRIETPRQIGPYRSDKVDKWRIRDHYGSTHPSIEEDLDPYAAWRFLRYKWQCGFKTKKQLTKWFTKKELYRLQRAGFRIVKIIPKQMISGKKQVIFKGRYATEVVSLRELPY